VFLLRTIVIVDVVIARFLYCTFIIYSAIRLPSRKCKCVINSVFSVQLTWQNLVAALQVHTVGRDTEICHILLETHCTAYSALLSPQQASSGNCVT